MKVVTVIPFKRGVKKDALSYFSSREMTVGSIVSVPIRRKNADALVTSIEDVIATKSAIKQASYGLRRIMKVKGPSVFSASFFQTAGHLADYFAAGLGETLDALLPDSLLTNYEKIIFDLPKFPNPLLSTSHLKQEKLIFQAPLEDRLIFYRTAVREYFARQQSLFICLPSINEIEHFTKNLQRGIEEYVFTLHGEMSNKDIIQNTRGILSSTHPVLILGTPQYLCLPRPDLSVIVLEHESSPAYRRFNRPYIDFRVLAEILSAQNHLRLILADNFLRTEILHRAECGEFAELSSLSFRTRHNTPLVIVDMKKEDEINRGFSVLSRELKEAVRHTIARKEHMFIFNLRKGLAPLTICHDCASILFCSQCQAPVVLYAPSDKERFFFCNRCRQTYSADTLCKNCNGWNLKSLGAGLEYAQAELQREFPDLPLFILDRAHATRGRHARELIQDFFKTPGSVLLGTEMAFFYLNQPVTRSAVTSLDALFSIPSFRVGEKILRLLLELRALSEEGVILQTRNPGEHILDHTKSSNLVDFYREEIKERRTFDYPPFKRLIKITRLDSSASVESEREKLRRLFVNYNPYVFSGFIPKIKGKFVTHVILKIDPARWDLPELSGGNLDSRLLFLLKTLSPNCSIQVDPEDILY
ncbi:MAG: Primosome assembly protein PriA [Parcubacteria group bacterium GW2011_GWA2_42_18]|nr:MAG: Primosome assembly protein PriA [Parcubacteria group bacterium GW2011_GWA2_42_18]